MKEQRMRGKKIVAVLLMLAVCVSCIRVETYAASNIRLNKEYVIGTIGKKVKLKVIGTKKKVKWSSDNTRVATVNSKGVVTGKRKGEAYIIAKVGNKKLMCHVGFSYANPKDGENDLYTVPKSMVYHSDYNSKTYKQAENLMKQVDKFEKSYSEAMSAQIWKDFEKAIREIPKDEYFLLYPESMTFEYYHHKYSEKRGMLTGYDQFNYVFYKYLAVNWDHLEGEKRENFIVNLIDSVYELSMCEIKKGNRDAAFVSFFSAIGEVRDKCSERTQRILDIANNMSDYYFHSDRKTLPGDGLKPSEYIDNEDKKLADEMKENEEKRQRDIKMWDDIRDAQNEKFAFDAD